jgi:hypothetical protein
MWTQLRDFLYEQGQISGDMIGFLQLDQIYLQDHHTRIAFDTPKAYLSSNSSHNAYEIKDNTLNY